MRRPPALGSLLAGIFMLAFAAWMWLIPGEYTLLFTLIDVFLGVFELTLFAWEVHKDRMIKPWGGIQA